MGIKGDVRSISLANVLQNLAADGQTGTLRIRHKDRQIALWFEKGALRLVGLGDGEGPSPLNGLIALGKLGPEDVPASTSRRTNEGSFLRGAAKRGAVSRDDLRAALEHQMGEHLCDAFLWSEATFEFEQGDPDDASFDTDQLDLEPRLAVDAVIMEALRRADEWGETRKAILSSGEILVPDPQKASSEADSTTRRVLALLDGERSLREIMELTRLGHFVVLRAAALLIKSGAARPLAGADAFERARARAAKEDWDAALRMARYGLDHERTNLGLLELALRCSEEKEDHDGAAGYARQLASAQVDSGALEAAVASYQKVLAHAPRDLTAHERLFALMIQLDLKLDALAAGEGLAAAYKKAGLPDKALDVYKRLVETLGDQTDLLESLAEMERHLGDKREALGIYRKLLARALEAKDDERALDVCRTMLKIDPAHSEALRLRRQLESGEVEKSRRRRRMLKGMLALGILVALLGLAGAYELRARSRLGEVRLLLLEARDHRRWAEALRYYAAVVDGWPWSLTARELRPERDQVEERLAEGELARASEPGLRDRLHAAIGGLEEARDLLRRGDLKGKVMARLLELRQRLRAEEDGWRERAGKMAAAEIAGIRDPLALAALEEMLAGGPPERRRAAVDALGGIEGDRGLEALIPALGDLDPGVVSRAGAHLSRRTGQDFGSDRLKWDEWWRKTERRPGKPPLQASLRAERRSFGAGQAVPVEWRIGNFGTAEVEIRLDGPPGRGLQVTGPGGPVAFSAAAGEGRTLRIAPGEFVGGTIDLTPALAAPGAYQLRWKVGLAWGGKPVEIEAAPLPLERAP